MQQCLASLAIQKCKSKVDSTFAYQTPNIVSNDPQYCHRSEGTNIFLPREKGKLSP